MSCLLCVTKPGFNIRGIKLEFIILCLHERTHVHITDRYKKMILNKVALSTTTFDFDFFPLLTNFFYIYRKKRDAK